MTKGQAFTRVHGVLESEGIAESGAIAGRIVDSLGDFETIDTRSFWELILSFGTMGGTSAMARRLGYTPEYVGQMARGIKPISGGVMRRLRERFGSEFSADRTLDGVGADSFRDNAS